MTFALTVLGVRFNAPAALMTLLIIPVLIGAYTVLQKKRNANAVKFTNVALLGDLVEKRAAYKRHLPTAFFIAGLTVLLIGIAQPQAKRLVQRQEATIMLVMDVSGSMSAKDVEPSRISSARESAKQFVDSLPDQYRVGLITFSTTVDVVQPPTDDHLMVNQALDGIEPQTGTALSAAIDRAVKLKVDLERPEAKSPQVGTNSTIATTTTTTTPKSNSSRDDKSPYIVVLLSDGAQTVGEKSPLESASEAAKERIPIFTIVLGTSGGSIPNPDPSTQGFSPSIRVPPDEDTLKSIANRTDGEFFRATNADTLKKVYASLGSKVGQVRREADVTFYFSIVAAVFLLIGSALSLWWQESLT